MNGRKAAVVVSISALVLGALPALASTSIVGQVATNDVRLDGALVPAGTTLFSGSVVATSDTTAVVHLANGRSVALDRNSQATFADAGEGDVRIAVDEGRASFQGTSGQPVMVMAKRTLLLQDEVGEGDAMRAEPVELCTYVDDGEWDLREYPVGQVDARLAAGDVYPCEENNDLGLDCDCEAKAGGYWAGLTNNQRTAWVVGAAAGAIVLNEEVLEDDEASP